MDRLYIYYACWLFTLLSQSALLEAEPVIAKSLSFEDIFRLEETTEPQFSPDGQQVVYIRIFADIDTDRKYSNLWIVDLDGQHHRPLTQGRFNDKRPRWSPDGKRILFGSNRGQGKHKQQLFTLNVNSQQLIQLTTAATPPRAHAWSPNGESVSYVALVEKPASSLVDLSAPPGASWTKPPVFINKLHYRFYGKYLPNGEDHLFVVSNNGGIAEQITPSGNHYSLSPHKTNTPVWSGDSRSLIFAANLHPDREFQPLESKLYQITLDNGAIKPLVQSTGPQHSPIVSPDGQSIVYLGYEGKGYKLVNQIYVLTKGDKQPRLINSKLDRSARQLQWSADSKGVFFLYEDQGNTKLGYVSLSGEHRVIAKDIGDMALAYASGSYHVSIQGDIVFTHSRPDRFGELSLTAIKKINKTKSHTNLISQSRMLVSVNTDVLDKRLLGKVEEIRYQSSIDGLNIQGWIVKPPYFNSNKKYPLIVNIHGGPSDNFGNRFSLMMQLMAAQGYIVLYTNPRGSSGYGEEFVEIIHQQAYPGKDFYDVNSGVDVLLQRDYIDKENLFVTGFSYGATLTCWMIAKTDRFRAAVPLAPVANWYSATLTTEAPVLYKQLSGGFPWEHQATYLKRSPLSLVGQVTTPTLLITGEVDYRNSISETEAYYTALKLKKIDAAMLRLQEADHFLFRRPSNKLRTLANILAWFDRYRVEVIDD